MGADVRLDPSGFGIEHKNTVQRVVEEARGDGEKPYYPISRDSWMLPVLS
jgi:1-aminocyclopropane-1-carboxylate deaminase